MNDDPPAIGIRASCTDYFYRWPNLWMEIREEINSIENDGWCWWWHISNWKLGDTKEHSDFLHSLEVIAYLL